MCDYNLTNQDKNQSRAYVGQSDEFWENQAKLWSYQHIVGWVHHIVILFTYMPMAGPSTVQANKIKPLPPPPASIHSLEIKKQ